jgi:hypothetical protein
MKSRFSEPFRLAAQAALAVVSIALCQLLMSERAPAACLQLAWGQLILSQSPSARFGHAMAYDSFRGITILFGGLDTNQVVLGDTWQFDNHGWKQLQPAHAPPARFRHTLSYDASRGRIVLFAGRDLNYTLGDLWEWNGADWTPIAMGTNAPAPRHWHGMAFDSLRGVHVLFGGLSGSQEYADTWEYNGNAQSWTLRANTGPSARREVALAYNATWNQMVLFGGYTSAGVNLPDHYLSDTWLWDGQSGVWSQQNPATVPQGRALYNVAYDSVRSVILMQNGEIAFDASTTATVRESWEWNGVDWSDQSGSYGFCCPRREAGLVYELAHQRMIMFGGDGFSPGGTWSLEPVWTEQDAVQVDWRSKPGEFPNVYQTVRQGIAAGKDCVFVDIRDGDYNETFFGFVPLVITKPVRLSAYSLFGDASTTVHIH